MMEEIPPEYTFGTCPECGTTWDGLSVIILNKDMSDKFFLKGHVCENCGLLMLLSSEKTKNLIGSIGRKHRRNQRQSSDCI